MVYTELDTPIDIQRRHAREYGFRCAALRDPAHALVNLSGATVTPEAAIFALNGKLLYRGRIDNTYVAAGKRRYAPTEQNLKKSIESVLHNKPVSPDRTVAFGCYIPEVKK